MILDNMRNHPYDWKNSGDLFYRTNLFYRNEFHSPVRKISVDAGLQCPNIAPDGTGGCIFCNNASFSFAHRNSLNDKRLKSIKEQIDRQISGRKNRSDVRFLVYFQTSTNTNASIDDLSALYQEALSHPKISGIIIGTRPDALPEKVVDLLSDLSKKTWLMVEIGLQTMHNETLRFLNRRHDYQTFCQTVYRLATHDIRVGVHLILGLPGETETQLHQTAKEISRLPIHSVKLHNLYVFENTKLADLYRHGKITLPSYEEYCRYVVDFLERLSPKLVVDRIVSSDVPDEYLIAPAWMAPANFSKIRFYQDVVNEFRKRNSFQGKLFQE